MALLMPMMHERVLDGWCRGVNVCVMHPCMGGVVTKWLERLQKCNIACLYSVRVSGRVDLRGICGKVRVVMRAYI
jgi:hypothetical protein